MSSPSQTVHQAFVMLACILNEAAKKQIRINEDALWALISQFLERVGNPSRLDNIKRELNSRGMKEWDIALRRKHGTPISINDIWEWFEKWWPDPVERFQPQPPSQLPIFMRAVAAASEKFSAREIEAAMKTGGFAMSLGDAVSKKGTVSRNKKKVGGQKLSRKKKS